MFTKKINFKNFIIKKFNKEISKDIDLLISQTTRCSEILKKISKKQIEEDNFLSLIKFEDLIEEIINSFKEPSSKQINLNIKKDKKNVNILHLCKEKIQKVSVNKNKTQPV